jgi:hypothetical protein
MYFYRRFDNYIALWAQTFVCADKLPIDWRRRLRLHIYRASKATLISSLIVCKTDKATRASEINFMLSCSKHQIACSESGRQLNSLRRLLLHGDNAFMCGCHSCRLPMHHSTQRGALPMHHSLQLKNSKTARCVWNFNLITKNEFLFQVD